VLTAPTILIARMGSLCFKQGYQHRRFTKGSPASIKEFQSLRILNMSPFLTSWREDPLQQPTD
jgi:hypothetical protein